MSVHCVPMVELGLGLVSIGRPWGVRQEPPPPEGEALRLLEKAVSLGIRFFDTAPAYGESEAILGRFLRRTRASVFVSTKMGEAWDPATRVSSTDHGYDALRRSIDRSLERLGRIDLLQVHKATADNLASGDVARAIEYAANCGVQSFGASVSDVAAAHAAMRAPWCTHLQFPFNRASLHLESIFDAARGRPVRLIVNRPFAMGRLVTGSDAFRFILERRFQGVILTGTRSVEHLVENHEAFTRC
jgi:aryl-alcohol dehydrogenase-like predicted oxidoreductase